LEDSDRWYDNIKVHLQDVGWRNMDWIDLAERVRWRALENILMNLWVP